MSNKQAPTTNPCPVPRVDDALESRRSRISSLILVVEVREGSVAEHRERVHSLAGDRRRPGQDYLSTPVLCFRAASVIETLLCGSLDLWSVLNAGSMASRKFPLVAETFAPS